MQNTIDEKIAVAREKMSAAQAEMQKYPAQELRQGIDIRAVDRVKLALAVKISGFASQFIGKSDEEKEVIKIRQKQEQDATKEMWGLIQNCDAVLVLNYDKNGINNYIGGNAFLELGFAYVLNKKIFLLNPIPDIPYYKTEIESMRPVILDGALTNIH